MQQTIKMYTIEEFAVIVNVHRSTVRMWVDEKLVLPIRTGRSFMFAEDEIVQFITTYRGYDVSNRLKARLAYQAVHAKND